MVLSNEILEYGVVRIMRDATLEILNADKASGNDVPFKNLPSHSAKNRKCFMKTVLLI
jgi:hypothetical protein